MANLKLVSSFQLKLIAVITMLVDHIGMLLFPQYLIFRIIGRISFPIFCFLISEGCIHTSNMKKYLIRLGLFAIISQIPFSLAISWSAFSFKILNVFFTLFLGALSTFLISKLKPYFSIPIVIAILIIAVLIHTDYSAFGVLLIIAFWMFRKDRNAQIIAAIIIILSYSFIQSSYITSFATMASVPILMYNGQKGRISLKYLFYIFYPAHLLILYFIRYYWF